MNNLETYRDFQGEIFLDTETCAGLKGPLMFIQIGFGKGSEVLVLEDLIYNSEEMQILEKLLDDPENTALGYNIGFDIVKLLEFFRRETPFLCEIIDLRLHLLRIDSLKGYPLLGQGKFSSIRFIHESVVDSFREVLIKRLTEQLPVINGEIIGEVKTVKSESFVRDYHKKRGEKYYDILFRFQFSTKMKELVPFFRPQLQVYLDDYPEITLGTSTGEAFYLPCNVFDNKGELSISFNEVNRKGKRWKEDKLLPYVTGGDFPKYKALAKANRKLMEEPEAYERAINYSRLDVLMLYAIYDFIVTETSIKPNYFDVATHQAACLRYFGLPLDTAKIEELRGSLTLQKEKIEQEVGINPRSSRQRIIFMHDSYKPEIQEILLIEEIKSANREVLLEGLNAGLFREDREKIVRDLVNYGTITLELNQLAKLSRGDGYFYPSIFIGESEGGRNRATGGLNILGISKKGLLRQCFFTLGGGDLDNLELRVMASVYKIEKMLEAIKENKDLHTLTVQAFETQKKGVEEEVDLNLSYEELMVIRKDKIHVKHETFEEKRQLAKKFIFAFSYGATAIGLARLLDCSIQVAEDYILKFYAFYPEVAIAQGQLKRAFCTYGPEGSWATKSVSKMKDSCVDIFGVTYKLDFSKKVCVYLAKNLEKLAQEACDSCDPDLKILRSDLKGEQTIVESIKTAIRGSIIQSQAYLNRKYLNLLIQAPASAVIQMLTQQVWREHHLYCLTIHDEAIYPPQKLSQGVNFNLIGETIEEALIEIRQILLGLTIDFRVFDTWDER